MKSETKPAWLTQCHVKSERQQNVIDRNSSRPQCAGNNFSCAESSRKQVCFPKADFILKRNFLFK